MTTESTPAAPPYNSFTRKAISVTFDVVNQDGSTGSLTLEPGHRISATIKSAGMEEGTSLVLTIEGMQTDDMKRLSHIGDIPDKKNPIVRTPSLTSVTVRAGTYGKVLPSVYFGHLTESFASFNVKGGGSPVFTVKASTAGILVIGNPTARSYPGTRLVRDLLDDVCRDNNIALVNHGGWEQYSVLKNHYAEGSTLDHIKTIMQACQGSFNYIPHLMNTDEENLRRVGHDMVRKADLHVWGPTYHETEDETDNNIPLISSQTGLIGYPEYSLYGLDFSCLFRPDIQFLTPINVTSKKMPAGWNANDKTLKNKDGQKIKKNALPFDGLWLPTMVEHHISSETPNGPWSTKVTCQRSDTDQNPPLPGEKSKSP